MHRSVVTCGQCRVATLSAFASLAGVSIATRPAPRLALRAPSRPACSTVPLTPIRSVATSSSADAHSAASTPPPPSTESPIPWYLQVAEPTPPRPVSPILALQEIPPLPPDPPAILAPVLEHLSTQIGLDDLVLLDLRHLDPPPALGANLLMVIGTARSVKHLNVSADRFCRWARREFRLRPYADGLLGRQELKLKLRRKGRRLKLAQSVGNTVAMREADDGITTGWICVNMGPVNDAVIPPPGLEPGAADEPRAATDRGVEDELADDAKSQDVDKDENNYENPADDEDEYENPADDGYVGFGSKSTSPRIVVQIFTQEKRVEMDLEGLWDVRNTRRSQRAAKADVLAEQAVATPARHESPDSV